MQLYHADCLDILPDLPNNSINAIITDLPYANGKTACEWDALIPLEPMWRNVWRLLRPGGVFITTANQPFTSLVIMSQIKYFKHEWIWLKSHSSNFMQSKYAPLKKHETVVVFGRGRITYNPQMTKGPLVKKRIGKVESARKTAGAIGDLADLEMVASDTYYPVTPQYFRCVSRNKSIHPTQKPVELYEYLVKTYTNPGETVLDIAMGSGTTGVACVALGRDFIGIERDAKYFGLAQSRLT